MAKSKRKSKSKPAKKPARRAAKRPAKKPAKRTRRAAPLVEPHEDSGKTVVLSHAEVLGDIETSLALDTLTEDEG